MIKIVIPIHISLNVNNRHIKHSSPKSIKICLYSDKSTYIFIYFLHIWPIVIFSLINIVFVNCIIIPISKIFPLALKINYITKRCILRLKTIK